MQNEPELVKGLAPWQVALGADHITKEWLAGELAAHHGASFAAALAALDSLSPNLTPMLMSPQGVTVLGFAASLRLPRPNPDPFVPTIH